MRVKNDVANLEKRRRTSSESRFSNPLMVILERITDEALVNNLCILYSIASERNTNNQNSHFNVWLVMALKRKTQT